MEQAPSMGAAVSKCSPSWPRASWTLNRGRPNLLRQRRWPHGQKRNCFQRLRRCVQNSGVSIRRSVPSIRLEPEKFCAGNWTIIQDVLSTEDGRRSGQISPAGQSCDTTVGLNGKTVVVVGPVEHDAVSKGLNVYRWLSNFERAD